MSRGKALNSLDTYKSKVSWSGRVSLGCRATQQDLHSSADLLRLKNEHVAVSELQRPRRPRQVPETVERM